MGFLPLEMQRIVDGGSDAKDAVEQLKEFLKQKNKKVAVAYA